MCSLSSSATESSKDGASDGGAAAWGGCSKGAGKVVGKDAAKGCAGSVIAASSVASPLCPNGCAGSVVLVGAAFEDDASVCSVNVKVVVATRVSKALRLSSGQFVRSIFVKSCLRISSLTCGLADAISCSVCSLAASIAFCFARSSSCSLAYGCCLL